MDELHEVLALLTLIRELAGHPSQYAHIRAAAVDRLNAINENMNPNPPAEEPAAEEAEEEEDA